MFKRSKSSTATPKAPVKKMKREKSTSTVGHYVRNADLLPAVLEAKELGVVTTKLISMIQRIAERYSSKHNFARYSYREDMVSVAVTNLCNNALKFNPERSSNPFSFYTSAIHNSFLQYMAEEKKQRNIRDALLADAGANPSYNFLEKEKDERDFELKNSDFVDYGDGENESLVSGDIEKDGFNTTQEDIELGPRHIRQRTREPSAVIEYTPDQYHFDPQTGQLTILVDRSAELITPTDKFEADRKKRREDKADAAREAAKAGTKKTTKKAAAKKTTTKKAAAKKTAKKTTKKVTRKAKE